MELHDEVENVWAFRRHLAHDGSTSMPGGARYIVRVELLARFEGIENGLNEELVDYGARRGSVRALSRRHVGWMAVSWGCLQRESDKCEKMVEKPPPRNQRWMDDELAEMRLTLLVSPGSSSRENRTPPHRTIPLQAEGEEDGGYISRESTASSIEAIPNPPIPGPLEGTADALYARANVFAKENGFAIIKRNGLTRKGRLIRYIFECD